MSDYIANLLETDVFKAYKTDKVMQSNLIPICKNYRAGLFYSKFIPIGYASVPAELLDSSKKYRLILEEVKSENS